jgi:hypothetical protein
MPEMPIGEGVLLILRELLKMPESVHLLLLQKSKIERHRKSRKVDYLPTPPLQYSVAPIRSSLVVFVRNDVVPHIAARETHQRS